ncbi:hypothetical protein ACFX1Z_013062 [Malus domestica]
MATAMKKVEKIRQIVRLKHLVMHWKFMNLPRYVLSYDNSNAIPHLGLNRRTPSDFLAVYIRPKRIRFVIPARFVNLPVFVGLLKKVEEFGFQSNEGLVLPCEVVFSRRSCGIFVSMTSLKTLIEFAKEVGGVGLKIPTITHVKFIATCCGKILKNII